MQVRGGAAVAVIAALLPALLLSGCVGQRVPPPGFTEAQLAELRADRIDQAWVNTGLEGTVERPRVMVPSGDATLPDLGNCLSSNGIFSWSIGDGPDGPTFGPGTTEGTTAAAQLIFYTCFAQFPTTQSTSGTPLTDAQRDYLYEYYQSWLIPCLTAAGLPITEAPTRDEFRGPMYDWWNPYNQAGFVTEEQHAAIVERCGDPYAGLQPALTGGSDATSIEYYLR